MSLQRRLLLYLLVCAPLVWGVALVFSIRQARLEVNEMFDTELIRLARQIEATLENAQSHQTVTLPPPPAEGAPNAGQSDVRDLAVAVWNSEGRVSLSDNEGIALPYRPDATGFVEVLVDGDPWRVYYVRSPEKGWVVAAGQAAYERDELVYGLTLAQVVPWLLVLPVLLLVMTWAVRRALAPMRHLTAELARRDAQDLRPVAGERAPAELKPLLAAMNGLFARIEELLVRERRFTADAAHELRTPLAVLGAQWDVVRHAASAKERLQAEEQLSKGLDRMGRLVTQMLSLSRAESGNTPAMKTEIDWHAIVEQAMSDCLSLAERRSIELSCEWPPPGVHPMPLLGDQYLLTVLLRNLLDNAVRYAPQASAVVLRIGREHLEVENGGAPLSEEQLLRLGERFHRPDGQAEVGSGLGVSIVRRIAQLHGLELVVGSRKDGTGVRAVLQFDAAHR
ncbi:ATP-binding protein [Variovorax soli]|uniref:ATP-binding protein n=1 Tax=Variovorax soli TaxID=376815 RepID=UPI000837AA9D|nr:ATP-binding protein [Variovorax soli]